MYDNIWDRTNIVAIYHKFISHVQRITVVIHNAIFWKCSWMPAILQQEFTFWNRSFAGKQKSAGEIELQPCARRFTEKCLIIMVLDLKRVSRQYDLN